MFYLSVLMWQREPHVEQSVWKAKFMLSGSRSTTRSVDAFIGYLRVESFEELGDLSGTSADGS